MSIANTNIAQTETSDLNDESVAGQSDTTIQYGPEHSNMTAVHDVDPFGAAFKARSLVKKCSLETSDGTLRLSRAIAASDRLMDHWNTKSGASACIEKLRNDDSPWGAELRKRQSTFYQEVNGISIDLINARNTTDEKGSTDLAQADRLIFGCKVSLDNSVPLERFDSELEFKRSARDGRAMFNEENSRRFWSRFSAGLLFGASLAAVLYSFRRQGPTLGSAVSSWSPSSATCLAQPCPATSPDTRNLSLFMEHSPMCSALESIANDTKSDTVVPEANKKDAADGDPAQDKP